MSVLIARQLVSIVEVLRFINKNPQDYGFISTYEIDCPEENTSNILVLEVPSEVHVFPALKESMDKRISELLESPEILINLQRKAYHIAKNWDVYSDDLTPNEKKAYCVEMTIYIIMEENESLSKDDVKRYNFKRVASSMRMNLVELDLEKPHFQVKWVVKIDPCDDFPHLKKEEEDIVKKEEGSSM